MMDHFYNVLKKMSPWNQGLQTEEVKIIPIRKTTLTMAAV